MYSSTFPLTTALDGVGDQRHTPAALALKRPGNHCTRGWVGPKISPPPGFDPQTVQSVASRYTD
jgi:hypothetical protein